MSIVAAFRAPGERRRRPGLAGPPEEHRCAQGAVGQNLEGVAQGEANAARILEEERLAVP